MRILVTGGSSFIGSHVINQLMLDGHNITTTVRHSLISPNKMVEVKNINLANSKEFDVLEDIEAIVHCAASLPLKGIRVVDFISDNIVATMNVLNFARQREIKRVIMCSSMAVYGEIKSEIVDHMTPSHNPDSYGLSKLSAEQIAASYAETVSTIALRLPGVLGKGAHDAFLPSALDKIKNNLPVTISDPDSRFNNLVHIADLALFISNLISSEWSGFKAMPVASLEQTTPRRAIEIMAEACGRDLNLEIISSNKRPFYIDDSKARSMGYQTQKTEAAIHRYALESQ